MISIGRTMFLVVAVILVAGLFVQVFLAGMGVFVGYQNFLTHRDTDYTLSLLPVVLIISGLVGRIGRRLMLTSVVVLLLFLLQSLLVGIRETNPQVAALRP